MPQIHPAAWAGLLLEAALLFLFFQTGQHLDPSMLSSDESALLKQAQDSLPLLAALLAFQAIALFQISRGKKAGIFIAAFSSFFLLPISLVYFLGCLYTFYQNKYKLFTSIQSAPDTAQFAYASGYPFLFFTAAGASLLMGWMGFSSIMPTSGFIGLIFAVTGLILGIQHLSQPALAAYDTYLTIVPSCFSRRLILSFAKLQSARLFPDKRIEFTVLTQERQEKIVWNLNSVRPKDQKKALEDLAKVLRNHQITLL